MISILDPAKESLHASVVCLGFFDGVHLGHQAIAHVCKDIAKQMNIIPCAHTYNIPPLQLIKPDTQLVELTPLQEKAALLEQCGIEVLAVSRFDEEMMRMPGALFFEKVVLGRLGAKHIVAGYDHRFGYLCDTDTTSLEVLCKAHGVGLTVVPEVKTADGQVVSSTAIRQALQKGDRAAAEGMLGRSLDSALLGRFKIA